VAATIVRAWASASSRDTSPSPSRRRYYEERKLIHSERNAAIGIGEAGTRRPLSRHLAYTAIRVGYANTHRSASEVQAIGSTHRKTPRRRTGRGQDTKGRGRSRRCCCEPWPRRQLEPSRSPTRQCFPLPPEQPSERKRRAQVLKPAPG
jgi:hypothetical protein